MMCPLKNKKKERMLSRVTFYCLLMISVLMTRQPVIAASFDDINMENFNLSKVKVALADYYQSGYYNEQINDIAQKVIGYVRFRSEANQTLEDPKKLAMIFDVDETSLSNYKAMKRLNFGGTLQDIKKAEQQANDAAIQEILRVYRVAQKYQVAVFFITGRDENERSITADNLKKAGYKSWEALYMKPNDYHLASIMPFKRAMRKKIKKMHYQIIANIGDQYSDLKGGYAEMSYKLPNPFYYIG